MEQTQTISLNKKTWAPLIPYITVGLGWLVFRNVWIAVLAYHSGIIAVLIFESEKVSFNLIFKSRNYKILIVTDDLGTAGGLLLFLCWYF